MLQNPTLFSRFALQSHHRAAATVVQLLPTNKPCKVHGSLSRARKVRGQTPKVAKSDHKKQPRGRAHKRLQYNRRFVTAVVGFGKKKGPNANEK